MKAHAKKKIAPIVVTALMLAYFAAYALLLYKILPPVWRIVLLVIPAFLGAAMICVCIQRLREIDGGEEDDIGQY